MIAYQTKQIAHHIGFRNSLKPLTLCSLVTFWESKTRKLSKLNSQINGTIFSFITHQNWTFEKMNRFQKEKQLFVDNIFFARFFPNPNFQMKILDLITAKTVDKCPENSRRETFGIFNCNRHESVWISNSKGRFFRLSLFHKTGEKLAKELIINEKYHQRVL